MDDSNNLRNRIQRYQGRLSKLDARVIEALLADPIAASYGTAKEVAELAGVHQTTVIRFARKLGYKGYLDLREALRHDHREGNSEGTSAASHIFNRLQHGGERPTMDVFLEIEIAALRGIPNHVARDDLTRAVGYATEAARIFIFARGHAGVLADHLAMRLDRLGFRAESLHFVDMLTPQQIAGFRQGDLLIAFALRRVPEQLPLLLSFAGARGGRSIVISDMIGPSIRPRPDALLAAPRGSETEWQTLSVPMALANILLLELSRRQPQRAGETLGRIEETREELEDLLRRPQQP